MLRLGLVLVGLLAGCSSVAREPHEDVASTSQRFESAEASLVDFDMVGRLIADTSDPTALRSTINAQLMFAVGPLNGERSVGWYERLDVSGIVATPTASGRFDVSYSAKLPVAWGAGTVPASYELVLPSSVSEEDQVRFTEKYGSTCVDPEGGDLNAGEAPDARRMFLFYRPLRPGCALAAEDVVRFTAKLTPSTGNTTGKYPEYHRVWEDGALDVVAVFGIESQDVPMDAGVKAFEDFVAANDSFLASSQADPAKRTTSRTTVETRPRAHSEASLPDGRVVRVDSILVGPELAKAGVGFDAWYDGLSSKADLIVYSGHAAHGANVRSLMSKGVFVPGKYVIWAANGCDTLAYVDRTLATRRAALNPGDPSGTKYMDTVSNVLGAWFRQGDETTMHLIRELVAGGATNPTPKTYAQIFAGIDRDQVVVVTGEEDNEYPLTPAPIVVHTPAEPPAVEGSAAERADGERSSGAARARSNGCGIGTADRQTLPLLTLLVALVIFSRRVSRGRRMPKR